MDLGALLLQAVAAVQSGAQALGTVDPTGAVVTSSATTMAKTWRDIVVGAWHGDLNKPCPWWVPIAAVTVFGLVGAGLTLAAMHLNPLENLASVLGFGATAAATAHGVTAVGHAVQGSEPTTGKPSGEPDLAGAVPIPLSTPPPISAPSVATPVPETPQNASPLVSVATVPLPPDQPQPLFNTEGVDISGIFDPAWQQAGIPRVLLLAAVLAESGLNPKAERWGSKTPSAQACIAAEDWTALQTIIDSGWPDISFGYSQRIVLYHDLGDRGASVRNCLAVRDAVFNDPAGDLLAMAQRLAGSLATARSGDLSPVVGDELLGCLAVYNGGHLYPPGDPWWGQWAGNIAHYRAVLDRIRASGAGA